MQMTYYSRLSGETADNCSVMTAIGLDLSRIALNYMHTNFNKCHRVPYNFTIVLAENMENKVLSTLLLKGAETVTSNPT